MEKEIDYHNKRKTLHPSTYDAMDRVDAAMFTGDPGEDEDKFLLMQWWINRWKKRIDEIALDPWYKESARLDDLKLRYSKVVREDRKSFLATLSKDDQNFLLAE